MVARVRTGPHHIEKSVCWIVVPLSTQPFNPLRSTKLDLVVKIKLPRSGSTALRQVNPDHVEETPS